MRFEQGLFLVCQCKVEMSAFVPIRLALEFVAPRKGERILEVGCGYGWVAHALWEAAEIEWFGIDRSETMLRHLRETAGGRPLTRADAHQLPLPDASFDKVLCSGVLMHVLDERAALRELARVLRPGGTLICTMQNALSLYNVPVRLHNALRPGFVQKFHLPATYRRYMRELGLHPRQRMSADGIITTQPYCVGRFSLPPQTGFPLISAVDEWLVSRMPWLGFEVWLSAIKPVALGHS
jgi:SAM-dependent methyltransferase